MTGLDDRAGLTVTPGDKIDVKAFWTTLGQRAIGMTVVTADSDEGPTGFLGLSAAHVTANPPTMLVSVERKTSALAGIISRRHFAVNFLPANAASIADAFGAGPVSQAPLASPPARGVSLRPALRSIVTRSVRSTVPSTRFWNVATSRSSSARSSPLPPARTATR